MNARRSTLYTNTAGQTFLRTGEMNLTQEQAVEVLANYGMPLIKTFGLRQCSASNDTYDFVVCDVAALSGPVAFTIAIYDRATDQMVDRFNAVK